MSNINSIFKNITDQKNEEANQEIKDQKEKTLKEIESFGIVRLFKISNEELKQEQNVNSWNII